MWLPVVLIVSVTTIDAAKILAVFPTPSISHQVVFRPLTRELARRGHEVIIVTPDPAFPKELAPNNLIEIDVHNASYAVKDALMTEAYSSRHNLIEQLKLLAQLFLRVFRVQLQNESFKEILKLDRNHFDLLLVEACATATLGLSHVFDAPVIQISSLGSLLTNHHALGIPMHPFIYPSSMRRRLYDLTISEKLGELLGLAVTQYVISSTEYAEDELLREHFGPDIPKIEKLTNNIDMLFINTHPMWGGNHPVPPNVIFIGGIHQNQQKELPQDLQNYLDNSEDGVVYVSFGTNVKIETFSTNTKQVLEKVFSGLSYNVLWKWDEEVPNKSGNIKISNWLPQADLLRHPKIKLFITQGGLQSTDEAITAGVPMIVIPILVDQAYNAEKSEHFNIGVRLSFQELTEQNLNESIHRVIGNESYRNNIVKLRTLMTDQPQTPLERATWWTEYVLRNRGARHLRSPAANMPWFQYLEVKLVAVVFTALLLLVITSAFLMKLLLKFISRLIKYIISTKPKVKTN